MLNLFKKLGVGVVAVVILFSFAQVSHAQLSDYTVLTPLPGTIDKCTGTTCTTNFSKYLPGMFNLIVAIAAGLAFVMITLGGITYATSDSIANTSQGKKWITNALYGLLLVIGAYVILYTINPQILSFDIGITAPVPTTPAPPVVAVGTTPTKVNGVLSGYILSDSQVAQNKTMIDTPAQAPGVVGVNNGGKPCADGSTHGCTNIVGLPGSTITSVKALSSACSSRPGAGTCAIVISGGTEGGHASHGPGLPVIDLQPRASLNAYLSTINPQAGDPRDGVVVNVPASAGGGTFTFEETGANGRASAPHWHVQY